MLRRLRTRWQAWRLACPCILIPDEETYEQGGRVYRVWKCPCCHFSRTFPIEVRELSERVATHLRA